MAKKPTFQIVTLGPGGHGKRAVIDAIVSVLLGTPASEDRWSDRGPDYAEYETAARHYCHIVLDRDHQRYVVNLITGAAQVDSLLLVVDLVGGVSAVNRDDLTLALELGVSKVVVFLNKADLVDDKELIRRTELDIRALLNDCGSDGDCAPVIVGSALKACEGDATEIGDPAIRRLLDAIETIPAPMPDVDKPLLFPIEDVFTITGRGTILAGRVERGVLKTGDPVEIVGKRDTVKSTSVKSIEMIRRIHSEIRAGDNAGLLLLDIARADVERGQVLCAPGSIQAHTRFESYVYLLTKAEGGPSEPYDCGAATFYFRTADFDGRIELPAGVDALRPGDIQRVTCSVNLPVAMEDGLRFGIRHEGRTVGAGVVLRILA